MRLLSELSVDASSKLDILEEDLAAYERQLQFTGRYDASHACTLCIQCGSGGVDAQDWTSMLYRMYKRYAEKKGFASKLVEESTTSHGHRYVELQLTGEHVYGHLSGERGIHRLVRPSPFQNSGKRQTSFASVEVIPELENAEADELELLEKVRVYFAWY